MNYAATLEYLFSQLPMYQREGKSAFKKDLSNTIELCKLLGNPEEGFKSIHIAGTNGKGSTAHMLASIFQEAGYKTGLYTSPHLKDFRERIRINGEMISELKVVEFVSTYQSLFQNIKPSFFEWSVALAFKTFADEQVDIAIIETGLGGRLDSTNVITPELSIITNIGFDHTDMLGDTLKKIATEKAGIIKKSVPIIVVNHSGERTTFSEITEEKGSEIEFTTDINFEYNLTSDLKGNYQKENIRGVCHAWWKLRTLNYPISYIHLQKGLLNVMQNTGLRGRWEELGQNPKIVAETAHNKEGLELAIEQLQREKYKTLHIVLGFVKDKNLQETLGLFPKDAIYYFCAAKVPRALETTVIEESAKAFGLNFTTFNSVAEAFEQAKVNAKPSDIIYVGGSNFVVAEIL